MEDHMEDIDSHPLSSYLEPSLSVSESLVPTRNPKAAGVRNVSFDGLLNDPLLLQEDLKEGCGGQLWPAGMLLAKYMLRHHSNLPGESIVELGAGGGLVGLAIARGCVVNPQSPIYITDQEPMLALMENNIKINNLSSAVIATVLNWGESEPLPSGIPSHPTIVLAADCVYFEPAFPLLISTLQKLLGPESVCYFCFKRRRRADLRFLKLARKAFDIDEIRDDPDVEASRRENLFLYLIRLKKVGSQHSKAIPDAGGSQSPLK